jgi:hypothetical protein
VFRFASLDWVKLDGDYQGGYILCLTKDIVREKAFDEGNNNDWRESTLRKWLNCTNDGFLAYLYKHDKLAKGVFRLITSDLTSDDGMKNYGREMDYVALLTCDLYRKYRECIPAVDEWYWTLTPWTCTASDSGNVRLVNSTGTLSDSIAYDGSYGVRPLCLLKSDIYVELPPETPEEEPDNRMYTQCASCGGELGDRYWQVGDDDDVYCSEECLRDDRDIESRANVRDDDE